MYYIYRDRENGRNTFSNKILRKKKVKFFNLQKYKVLKMHFLALCPSHAVDAFILYLKGNTLIRGGVLLHTVSLLAKGNTLIRGGVLLYTISS